MRPSSNREKKSRFGREAPAGGGPALTRRQEKYSNLVFLGFNAVFLVALFWLLPALGTDFPHSSAQAATPGRETNATTDHALSDGAVHAYPISLPAHFIRLGFGQPR